MLCIFYHSYKKGCGWRLARVGLLEEVRCEQRLEGGVAGRPVALWGRSSPGWGHTQCPVFTEQHRTSEAPLLPREGVLGSPEAGGGGVGPRRLFGHGE